MQKSFASAEFAERDIREQILVLTEHIMFLEGTVKQLVAGLTGSPAHATRSNEGEKKCDVEGCTPVLGSVVRASIASLKLPSRIS